MQSLYRYNFSITEIHIDQVKIGDTVDHHGQHKTVGKNNIKHSGFCGTTLFGDSYKSGYQPVKKVTIYKAVANTNLTGARHENLFNNNQNGDKHDAGFRDCS